MMHSWQNPKPVKPPNHSKSRKLPLFCSIPQILFPFKTLPKYGKDDVHIMEQITFAVVFSIIVTALYAVMKYAERYYGENPEKWDQTKFLQLVVVAFVIVIVGYLGQGVIAMPEPGLIGEAMALLGGAVFTLTGIKLGKNVLTTGTTKPPAPETPPVVAAPLPGRSYKMTDSVRQWLTFDATPENKEKILARIQEAESQQLVSYRIIFVGGYYDIEYGNLKGSAGNPSGK